MKPDCSPGASWSASIVIRRPTPPTPSTPFPVCPRARMRWCWYGRTAAIPSESCIHWEEHKRRCMRCAWAGILQGHPNRCSARVGVRRRRWVEYGKAESCKRMRPLGRGLDPPFQHAPTQSVPVVRQNPKETVRELSLMHWGLIPYWAKNPPKPSPYQATRFVNNGQRKFYWLTVAFTVAKVLAIITVFLLMLGAL